MNTQVTGVNFGEVLDIRLWAIALRVGQGIVTLPAIISRDVKSPSGSQKTVMYRCTLPQPIIWLQKLLQVVLDLRF
ncbi:hypothetical protein [Nostoc sp.]|uniref:hypothetical protein n=1 Tax=Nostoc sp. TaxID=1180 RepID=UPI002FFC2EDF